MCALCYLLVKENELIERFKYVNNKQTVNIMLLLVVKLKRSMFSKCM